MQSADIRFQARFRHVMPQLVHIGATVDLGPPPIGTLPFLTHTWGSKPSSPFFRDIDSYDHTFAELLALRKQYACNLLQIMYPNALREYDEGLHKEMRVRFLVRKWIGNVRRRIMLKKGLNEEDLFTTMPIPDGARVRVCDYISRRFYDFHTTTLVRTITAALFFNNWGIPDPQMPKNPYTNLTWNTGQLISIVQQIVNCLNRNNRILPPHIAQFRIGCYDCDNFYDDNVLALRIYAAQDYFKNLNDPDVLDSYIESMDDLYDSSYESFKNQKTIRRLVVNRKLPTILLRRWDTLVVGNWIYLNHIHLIHPWKAFEDMIVELHELHALSTQWWNTQPRRIKRRPTLMSPDELPTIVPRSVFIFGADSPRTVVPENAIIVRLPVDAASSVDDENEYDE